MYSSKFGKLRLILAFFLCIGCTFNSYAGLALAYGNSSNSSAFDSSQAVVPHVPARNSAARLLGSKIGRSQQKMTQTGSKQRQIKSAKTADYVAGEIIVKYKKSKINLESNVGRNAVERLSRGRSLQVKENLQKSNTTVLKITDTKTVEQKIQELKNDPNVEYAEPNYKRNPTQINTNDTDRALLWALDNTGQTVNGVSGTPGADINAPEAWSLSDATASAPVIVAVIDTGVAYNHPDLAANMWDGTNCKDENGNQLNNCNHGYDFADNDATPLPVDAAHGTNVSGVIAAEKNNNKGVVGVAGNVKIMAIRFAYDTATEVKAIDFATQNGAKVINASYGGLIFAQAEYDAIARFRAAGGIFVAAAGNSAINHDAVASNFYPSDYDLDNIISVAATDQHDTLASFSDYGATSVDVGAPGANIYSTTAENIVLNENFENTPTSSVPGGWTTSGVGNNWGIFDYGGFDGKVLSGDLTQPYSGNVNTTIASPVYNFNHTTDAFIFFYTQCDTEYATSTPPDYMALDYTKDGVNFDEIARWGEADLDGGFPDGSGSAGSVLYGSIPARYYTSQFQFRFRWVTNAVDNNHSGCFVDDMWISKITDGSDEQYSFMDGTSFAAPQVAGEAALLWGYKPNLTAAQVKQTILNTGDTLPSLASTVSGKRINLYAALASFNQAPVAVADSTSTYDNTSVTIAPLVNDTDPDGQVLSLVSVSTPAHGTAAVTGSTSILYTPTSTFTGLDSFSYIVSDTLGATSTAQINITVNGLAPTVVNFSPADNSTGVVTTTQPYIDFSEPVLASTVNSTNIKLRLYNSNADVTTALVLENNNTRVRFIPQSNLTPNTQYYFFIGSNLTDVAGVHFAGNTWYAAQKASHEFTTAAAPIVDTIAPVITLLGITPVTVTQGDVYTDAGATALDDIDGNITANIITINPVNTNVVGTYILSYNVSDAANNAANQVTRAVNVVAPAPAPVVDTTAPVITLLGTTPVTVTQGDTYTDAGATAFDDADGNITANIITVNPVDVNVVGTYIVSYNVSDAAHNAANQVTRTVNVVAPTPAPIVDTTAPVITLLGTTPVTITQGNVYTDAGATALDDTDGDITANIVTVNPVDTNVVGTYIVSYNVTDAAHNAANQVTRTVNVVAPTPIPVVDTTIPVITLLGTTPVTVTQGDTYTDAGATALDDTDGDITANIVTANPVDVNVIGTYIVSYNVTDAAHNAANQVTRTVNVVAATPAPVVDTTAPVITLLGSTPVTVTQGNIYSDAGATASDNIDGDITSRIVINNSVNTSTVGTYAVTYNVTDTAGNAANQVTRSVNVVAPTPTPVVDTTAPVITLLGSTPVTVTQGDTYTDAGATALDDTDGNITANIVTVNPVNINVVGAYLVTYNVTDAAHNAANQVTRTVNVVAPTPTPAPVVPTPAPSSGSSFGGIAIPVTINRTVTAAPVVVTSPIVVPAAPAQVLGIKITRLDELVNKLIIGSHGTDVVALQDELRAAGFFPSNVKSTGFYGPITVKAVLAYLTSDSNHDLLAYLVAQTKRGQQSDLVKQLQNELKKKSFLGAKIFSTSFYGVKTAEAVVKYQASLVK